MLRWWYHGEVAWYSKASVFKALGDIQIAVKALQDEEESLEHPVDKHYKTLHCAMTPLDHDHDDFKVFMLSSTPYTCMYVFWTQHKRL